MLRAVSSSHPVGTSTSYLEVELSLQILLSRVGQCFGIWVRSLCSIFVDPGIRYWDLQSFVSGSVKDNSEKGRNLSVIQQSFTSET